MSNRWLFDGPQNIWSSISRWLHRLVSDCIDKSLIASITHGSISSLDYKFTRIGWDTTTLNNFWWMRRPSDVVRVWLWDRPISGPPLVILHPGTRLAWKLPVTYIMFAYVNCLQIQYLLQGLEGRTLLSCENITDKSSSGNGASSLGPNFGLLLGFSWYLWR